MDYRYQRTAANKRLQRKSCESKATVPDRLTGTPKNARAVARLLCCSPGTTGTPRARGREWGPARLTCAEPHRQLGRLHGGKADLAIPAGDGALVITYRVERRPTMQAFGRAHRHSFLFYLLRQCQTATQADI
jgi:hypothetical protein